MEAMRRDDSRAIDEFLVRYQRLLFDRARRAGIERRRCENCIIELLEDLAMGIVSGRLRPEKLSGYVFRAFSRRFSRSARKKNDPARPVHGEMADSDVEEEDAFVAAHSDHSVRASRGADWEPARMSPALERLASMLDDGLTPDEQQLLGWMSRYIEIVRIADWLAINSDAAEKRITRLRARLREVAARHVSQFSDVERHELRRFFRRVGERYGASMMDALGEDPKGPAAGRDGTRPGVRPPGAGREGGDAA